MDRACVWNALLLWVLPRSPPSRHTLLPRHTSPPLPSPSPSSSFSVAVLLWKTNNITYFLISVFLVVLQFLVVHFRVLPYLRTTFGSESLMYIVFLVGGFPLGILFLDGLMFLEPFGLLAMLPFPPWIKQFLPAYKATRIIAEVAIEAFCMSLLQSYIYVVVMAHSRAGVASPEELAMVEFASVLPTSIVISTINMLKMWIEVVSGAQQAGLTVTAKAIQLWEVGAGLPLDALKKGAIVEWACPYLLAGPEISPLLDALGKNTSLTHLDMTRSGLTWSGANATGGPLLENMATSTGACARSATIPSCTTAVFASDCSIPMHYDQSPLLLPSPSLSPTCASIHAPCSCLAAALSALKSMVISSASGCKMPIKELRKGGHEAIAALHANPFFSPGW